VCGRGAGVCAARRRAAPVGPGGWLARDAAVYYGRSAGGGSSTGQAKGRAGKEGAKRQPPLKKKAARRLEAERRRTEELERRAAEAARMVDAMSEKQLLVGVLSEVSGMKAELCRLRKTVEEIDSSSSSSSSSSSDSEGGGSRGARGARRTRKGSKSVVRDDSDYLAALSALAETPSVPAASASAFMQPRPSATVEVCMSGDCRRNGAAEVARAFTAKGPTVGVECVTCKCMGSCPGKGKGVQVQIRGETGRVVRRLKSMFPDQVDSVLTEFASARSRSEVHAGPLDSLALPVMEAPAMSALQELAALYERAADKSELLDVGSGGGGGAVGLAPAAVAVRGGGRSSRSISADNAFLAADRCLVRGPGMAARRRPKVELMQDGPMSSGAMSVTGTMLAAMAFRI